MLDGSIIQQTNRKTGKLWMKTREH